MARYHQVKPGEWVQPVRKGYKLSCCDCGLVHDLDFRLVVNVRGAKRIQFRAFRNERATALTRRAKPGLKLPK